MSIWKRDCILLGHVGDNQAHDITVDVSSILSKWPEAYIEVLVTRPTETQPYIADSHVDTATGKLYWHVNNSDTGIVGYGKAELVAVVDGGIAYTCTVTTKVKPILDGLAQEDPPDPATWWVEEVITAGAAAEEAQEVAEAAAEAAADDLETVEEYMDRAEIAASAAQESEDNARVYAQNAAESKEWARVYEELSRQNAITHGFIFFESDESGVLYMVVSDGVEGINPEIDERGWLGLTYEYEND